MIINALQGDVKVIGDVKEFKTSIDPKNLEFITTLLSSNLYSDPEQSFIREIVSNAWDSHVEAGTTDIPVIIKFKKDYDDYSITIRDYGTGLSPERFNEIYRNIGSSTKRESNDYIGAFGVGHLVTFACSNATYITSYYKGIAYYYVGTKSNNTITYHQLRTEPTTEKNGVEITIKGITEIQPYRKALNCITFFPNIYVDGIDTNINNVKIKKFKYFAAATTYITQRLLLGNVLYPCNKSLLPANTRRKIDKIEFTGIVVKFDIGELSITPNRENIIYNQETINKIIERVDKAYDELMTLIKNKISKDYDDIIEYYNILTRSISYDPVTDNLIKSLNYEGCRIDTELIQNSVTYKGKNLETSFGSLRYVLSSTVPNYKGVVYKNKFYKKRLPYEIRNNNIVTSKNILILNSKARLTEIVKTYLRRNYDTFCIMSDITYQEFESWVIKEFTSVTSDSNKDIILKGIYEALIKRAKKLNLNTDTDYLNFKASLQSANKTITPIKDVILYIYKSDCYRIKETFNTLDKAVKYIKDFKQGIILTSVKDHSEILLDIAKIKGYIVIEAKKEIVTALRNLNLTCVVDNEWLLYKDPIIPAIKTVLEYFPETIAFNIVTELRNILPKEEIEELERVFFLRNRYGINYAYRCLVKNSKDKDPYTEYICRKIKKYITIYNSFKLTTSSAITVDDITILAALVMKTKAFRINYEIYKQIKNNPILKILCKK